MKRRTLTIAALVACFVLVRLVMRQGDPAAVPVQEPRADDALAAQAEHDRADTSVAPQVPNPDDAIEIAGDTAASGSGDSGAGAWTDDPAMTRLHAELLGMRVAARDSFLRLTIRDAKFPCETVNSASALPDRPLWRVSCAGAHHYMIRIGDIRDIHVDPILWDSVTPAAGPFDRTLELVPPPEPQQ